MNNVELAAHQSYRPARPRLPLWPHVPGNQGSRQDRTAVSSPDNGAPYISHAHAAACRELGIRHIRTRPYRPRTNGKAERFIQTILREWAYARTFQTSAHRTTALKPWLLHYNFERPHGALSHKPPGTRLTNLPRNYS